MSQLMQAIAATAMLCLLTGYAAGKYTVLTQSIDSVELASESDSDHEAIEALSNHTSTADAFQSFANENHKLTLIVRTDLRMTKGKIAAQAGHATLACYKRAAKRMPQTVRRWERSGQAKIALKGDSDEHLEMLQAMAMSLGLVAEIIHDAGRTQIAAGTSTVLGIGPGPQSLIDQVSGGLSLL